MDQDSIILLTDSYKVGHWLQKPPNTEASYYYLEARLGAQFPIVTFVGLQPVMKKYLAGPVVTEQRIAEADELFAGHFGTDKYYNRDGWRYILNEYGGHLPIRIKAVPEGTRVPIDNIMLSVESTDKKCEWIAGYLEGLFVQLWYPFTVATASRAAKDMILKHLAATGDPSLIDYKLHDFGFRGVSSVETARIGSASHMVNFKGTDTVPGLPFIMDYYNTKTVHGNSIMAAEHSTITSWSKTREAEAYLNMLERLPDGFTGAFVSDSYDLYKAVRDIWGEKLHDKVMGRNGTVVIRPDSGDPPTVVSDILSILYNKFGGTWNEKGYKVLDPHVRLIQGDGIRHDTIDAIFERAAYFQYSADNIALGSGGGLLQMWNRDTQRVAMKMSAIKIDGVWHDVYKEPKTDMTKKSKRGRLMLHQTITGEYQTRKIDETNDVFVADELVTVFENGKLIKEWTFEEIKERAAK